MDGPRLSLVLPAYNERAETTQTPVFPRVFAFRLTPDALAGGVPQPGAGHVQLQHDGRFDPAAVPLDDVQDGPAGPRRRGQPDGGQLPLRVAGQKPAAEDARQVARGRGVA